MCECDYTPTDDDTGGVVTASVARSHGTPRTQPETRRRGDGDDEGDYSQAQKPPGPRSMTLGSRSMSSAPIILRSCSTPHQRYTHDQPQTRRTVIGRKHRPLLLLPLRVCHAVGIRRTRARGSLSIRR